MLVVVQETVGTLKERACAAFGIEPAKVEIWDYFNHGKYANLENQLDKDLDAARVLDDQPILLDDKVGHAHMQPWSCILIAFEHGCNRTQPVQCCNRPSHSCP